MKYVAALEAECFQPLADLPKPPGRVFVLTLESQSPLSQAEQLSAFRSASGVGPHDHLVVITFN
jgi:hypothetical protein